MQTDLAQIASKLNGMGFPNKIVGNTIEATIPLPYSPEYVQPSFKLYYSPEQKLIYFRANRYSTEKLLRKLKPQLREISKELGLSFATREGFQA
jgi:hypothetical protein